MHCNATTTKHFEKNSKKAVCFQILLANGRFRPSSQSELADEMIPQFRMSLVSQIESDVSSLKEYRSFSYACWTGSRSDPIGLHLTSRGSWPQTLVLMLRISGLNIALDQCFAGRITTRCVSEEPN